jgi:hypothetical protein
MINLFLFTSFAFVTCYSFLKHLNKKEIISLSNADIAIMKLISILCLLEKSAPNQVYNIILLFYALGDLIIVWSQPFSLIFFQVGHLFFLSTYHQYNISYEYFLPILAGLTFIIYFTLLYQNPGLFEKHYEYVLYWIYIFVLHCFLFVPLFHGYVGTIPFIISDISIGFELDVVHSLEYPLYYISLLYLRVSHLF